MTIVAYSYQRFSSLDQIGGDSLTRQSTLAESYARDHELELDNRLTIRDLGVSGYRGQNAVHGELGHFLTAVRNGRIAPGSYLLIESLDRLSRSNILQAQNLLTELILAKINVVSLVDNRTYSEASLTADPLALIFALIVFIRANEESSLKSFRAKQAWIRKRDSAGTQVMTSRVPDWLIVCKATGQIVARSERAEVLSTIFQLALDGRSPFEIADHLNARGVCRWRGSQPWTRPTVSTLLRNRRVTGVLPLYIATHDNGETSRRPIKLLADYFPRLIEPEAFLKVQALASTRRRGGNAAKLNVFANMLFCAGCGAPVRHHSYGEYGRAILACDGARILHGCNASGIDYDAFEIITKKQLSRWIHDDLPWHQVSDPNQHVFRAVQELSDLQSSLSPRSPGGAKRRAGATFYAEVAKLEDQIDDLIFNEHGFNAKAVKLTSKLAAYLDEEIYENTVRVKCNMLLRQLGARLVVDFDTGWVGLSHNKGFERSWSMEENP